MDAVRGETDASGKSLGLMGRVCKHQPDVVANLRSGWTANYLNDDVEKVFTVPRTLEGSAPWGFT
ncbi:hypothetical protein ACNFR7_04810 [Streptomyces sp. RM1]|uniref:hypothetical protein n=1 Tax=Streptomyces misionensis TaxID=67331 RepID=UPI00396B5773